ncbi:MAG TPA: hypothetical protein QGH10_18545, partial [Armatimonadota bacterium]|nr:hypothetical protein [Armatimonadota bacterium]
MARALTILVCLLTVHAAICQENLLANPSLEDVDDGAVSGWEMRPPGGVQPMRDGGHDGDGYARFVDDKGSAGITLESTRIPARPGGTYRASARLRTGDDCSPGLYLNFYDDLGVRVHHLFNRVDGPTDGWTELTVETQAPAEVVHVSVSLYAYIGDIGTFDGDMIAMTVEGGSAPGSGGIPRADPGEKDMVDIGSRLELFVDSHMTDAMTGEAYRKLHHPTRGDIVLTFD